jgi:integrase
LTKPLTAAAVRKFRAGATRRRIRDAGARSLFLVIEPSGHKSWQMRFRRPTGKPGKLTLGPLDISGRELQGEPQIGQPLTLAAARQLAAAVQRERAMGRDPIADRKAAKHRQRAEFESREANTFAAAVRDYMVEYLRTRTRKRREVAALLGLRYGATGKPTTIKGGLFERWADKPVRAIDGHDIYSLIDETRRIGVPGLVVRTGVSEARAKMLFVALSSMFNWLRRHRRIDENPCASVHPPAKEAARDRVLSNAEIVEFWNATMPFSQLLKLLLLTGCRLREVAGMTRGELSDDGATWNLPGARTKNRRPHIVPLPPLARELLASVPNDGNLIFTTTGTTPISGWSRMKRRLDALMERGVDAAIPPWRLHDLRRTAATGMAEIGIAPHIVEACLNHVSGAKASVAGVYNRALHAEEKQVALERWAAHVEGMLAGRTAKVLPMRGRRARA